jgi:hypothetical protein
MCVYSLDIHSKNKMKTETETEKIVQLNIDLPESEKSRIKMAAMLSKESLKDFAARALREYSESLLKKKGVTLPFNYPPQCFVNANQLFAS